MTNSKKFITASGGEAWFCRFDGEVLHADRTFETHVSSSGGGGNVGQNGGYVAAPQVSSQSIDHQTVFVRADDGGEQSFEWRNWNLPIRPGSRVAVIWGARNGTDVGPFLAACNSDTGEERWCDIRQWARAQRLLSGNMRGWPSAIAAVLMATAFMIFTSFARARAGSFGQRDLTSDFLLATLIAFVPALFVEWVIAIIVRVSDDEHIRIQSILTSYLRTGEIAEP